ncbi:hypothetical protein B0H13DRAFT_1916490 [Mycena leptocephala]|nr:hypothetical protein B0H13DRAFT_1916490 [Mycena leptocephala]
MHPYIAMFIHEILSLNIDYTFKRVEGAMDEWEVAGFLDRFKQRLTFASLYCDRKTREAFAQLFTELFDTVRQRDIEPQYGEMLGSSLKTCTLHFERHIDELPMHISKADIARLKSILGLNSQEDIDAWHEFCAAHDDPAIQNWYQQKLANPWILPSVNKFLSKISADNWDITPNHYVETAHAGRNAETSVGVGLLTGIFIDNRAKERDDVKAAELTVMARDAQRQQWKIRKAVVRRDQLTGYDSLKAERDSGNQEHKESVEREKTIQMQIKSLQGDLKLDRRRTDLQEQILSRLTHSVEM